MEGRVGRVVVLDADREVADGVRDARARHRREVGQHRTEEDGGSAVLPARNGRVPEEVHVLY